MAIELIMTSAGYDNEGTAELQTANVAFFQRKVQFSGFSTYSCVSPPQLTRIIRVLLYFNNGIYNSYTFYGQNV
jgi:hypothetical protein